MQKQNPLHLNIHGKFTLFLACLFSMILLQGCSGTKVAVEKASRQKYHGGAAGSGGGNIYRVYVSKNAKSELSIDRVWVGDRETGFLPRFMVYRDSTSETLRDHIIPIGVTMARIEFTERLPVAPNPRQGEDEGPEPPNHDDPPYDLPVDFVKGVVIWYTPASGKSATWVVDKFEQLAPIFHP